MKGTICPTGRDIDHSHSSLNYSPKWANCECEELQSDFLLFMTAVNILFHLRCGSRCCRKRDGWNFWIEQRNGAIFKRTMSQQKCAQNSFSGAREKNTWTFFFSVIKATELHFLFVTACLIKMYNICAAETNLLFLENPQKTRNKQFVAYEACWAACGIIRCESSTKFLICNQQDQQLRESLEAQDTEIRFQQLPRSKDFRGLVNTPTSIWSFLLRDRLEYCFVVTPFCCIKKELARVRMRKRSFSWSLQLVVKHSYRRVPLNPNK